MAERFLEGWAPVLGVDMSVAEAVELAFDYRGDVTLVLGDGTTLTGFVYNRDAEAAEPYLQLWLPHGERRTVHYAEVRALRFSGRDAAAAGTREPARPPRGGTDIPAPRSA
jgi:hypothetical protein